MINKLEPSLKKEVKHILNYRRDYNTGDNHLQQSLIRIMDVILGIICFTLFSPVFIFTGFLILFNSGLPIIFKQKRIGKNGKLFHVYKFRTMRKDAEKILKSNSELYKKYIENDYKLKPEEDPRILKFGNFLRASSIDEIPQFINVIKGEMSLVGPRPIVPDEIAQYEEFADTFTSVKPGITGLWQVCGRSEVTYPDRKYLDIIYIKKKNIITDCKILFKTVIVVFKKIGAH